MFENELIHRTTSIAEELVRLCDTIGQPLAAAHISAGIDALRAASERGGPAFGAIQHVSR